MATTLSITSAQQEEIATCLRGIEQARVELAKLHPDNATSCAALARCAAGITDVLGALTKNRHSPLDLEDPLFLGPHRPG
jgi:hypothetical protein